jgi:hypothetical protein
VYDAVRWKIALSKEIVSSSGEAITISGEPITLEEMPAHIIAGMEAGEVIIS